MALAKRIGAYTLLWLIVVGCIVLMSIGDLDAGLSYGAHHVAYDVAFTQERYLRAHLDDPCPLASGGPCSPQDQEVSRPYVQHDLQLYADYHRYFWEDVWALSRLPVIVSGVLLIIAGVLLVRRTPSPAMQEQHAEATR